MNSDKYSDFPEEKEILFDDGSKLNVNDVSTQSVLEIKNQIDCHEDEEVVEIEPGKRRRSLLRGDERSILRESIKEIKDQFMI